jgi:hypothetical protein
MSVAEAPSRIDATIESLIDVQRDIANLEDLKAKLLAEITDAHDLGLIADKITTHDGWTISHSPGRKLYDYPDDVTALETSLKAAKEAAVATRRATLKPSTPYWSVRAPKPPKEAV